MKPTIHFVGEPPLATKIKDPPKPAPRPAPGPAPRGRMIAIMRVRGRTWAVDGTAGTAVPPTVINLIYRHDAGEPHAPVVLPPAGSLPVLQSLSFDSLPIRSIAEIANIDAYRSRLHSISFLRCTSLVLDDLSWFVPMAAVQDARSARERAEHSINIQIVSCRLWSLRGMEQFQRVFSLQVPGNGIDLEKEIGYIEACSKNHAASSRSSMSVGMNRISGRTVQRKGMMRISDAAAYIRDQTARASR